MSHTLDSLRYAEVSHGKPRHVFYGHRYPEHVAWVEEQYNPMTDAMLIRWINTDGSKHECPLNRPATPEGVNAVLVAMKLSY